MQATLFQEQGIVNNLQYIIQIKAQGLEGTI